MQHFSFASHHVRTAVPCIWHVHRGVEYGFLSICAFLLGLRQAELPLAALPHLMLHLPQQISRWHASTVSAHIFVNLEDRVGYFITLAMIQGKEPTVKGTHQL